MLTRIHTQMRHIAVFHIGNKMSSESSAFSSPQVSRQISPVPKIIEPKNKPGRLKRMARGIGAGVAWTLATADNAANFVKEHPGITLIAGALGTGGYGAHLYKQANAPRVATVKSEPVIGVPKQYAEHLDYYGPNKRFAPPPNVTNTSKYDAMFPTPSPTPTPSITNPMNNTEINVVNHNSTKS